MMDRVESQILIHFDNSNNTVLEAQFHCT